MIPSAMNRRAQPGWEGSLGENGYMHTYGGVLSVLLETITTLAILPYKIKHVLKLKKICESNTETHTFTVCKRDNSGHLLCDTGNQSQPVLDNLGGWDGEGGGTEVQERDTCIPMASSC